MGIHEGRIGMAGGWGRGVADSGNISSLKNISSLNFSSVMFKVVHVISVYLLFNIRVA